MDIIGGSHDLVVAFRLDNVRLDVFICAFIHAAFVSTDYSQYCKQLQGLNATTKMSEAALTGQSESEKD